MTLRRLACALVAAPAFFYFAAAQIPAPAPLAAPPPVIASPFPAVSAPLTPATPVSAPISAPPSPIGIAPYPPPPGGPTLWSFLGMSYQQREYRQRQMARTPLGKVREKIQTPLSKLTKGIIPPFPPKTPSLAELQAPGPVGAAAKLKLDRAAAGERVKAVKELGTADCHYWPEAEDALVGALRNDRNEWVRLAAAETLGNGCCCTKKTIIALTNACTCSNADGAPAEKSPRVVAAACASLNKCLAAVCATPVVTETIVVPEGEGQQKEGPLREGPTQAAWSKPGPAGGEEKSSGGLAPHEMARPTTEEYYARVATRPWSEVVEYAMRGASTSHRIPQELFLTGGGYDETAVANARGDRPTNLLDVLLGEDESSTALPRPAMAMSPATVPQQAPPTARPTQRPFALPDPPAVQRPAPLPNPTLAQAPPVAQPATQEPMRLPVVASAPTPPQAAPLPAKSAQVHSNRAMQVMTLLQSPADPRRLEAQIDLLTGAEVAESQSLITALMKATDEIATTTVRAACVRAVVRSKAATPEVMAGLERLVNDRSTVVRVEAAAGLEELRRVQK